MCAATHLSLPDSGVGAVGEAADLPLAGEMPGKAEGGAVPPTSQDLSFLAHYFRGERNPSWNEAAILPTPLCPAGHLPRKGGDRMSHRLSPTTSAGTQAIGRGPLPRWPGKRPSSILPLFPVAAVEKVDQIVGLFDGHVDQRDADLDNGQPREHIDDVPRAFRCLLNVVALSHGV
ncbi:hypothetical protein MES5069_230104 [Mesorhizobium escarrei]|uniref:Uncharacterized protein n=1 Tax=Mesorhizobium escarrei TaxID=666018 RepID=A0ABM9DSP2_9HYPH|nr:hypothetical protein MES5069_230104 [Mesorhizobium escarrei]